MNNHLSTRKSLTYGAIVTVFFLLFLELIARAVEFAQPPSETSAISSLPPKDNNTFRIFFYGGSTVYGSPVQHFGFVSQLEYWLRRDNPDKPLEVYNFARRGSPSAYVRAMVDESINHDPDLIVIMSGHNEFLSRKIDISPNKYLSSFALTRVLDTILRRTQRSLFGLPDSVVTPKYAGYDRNSSLFREKVQVYLDNLSHITETARNNTIPIILLTAPSNTSDWPPVHKEISTRSHNNEYNSSILEVNKFLTEGLGDKAIKRLRKLLLVHQDDPQLLYMLADAYEMENDYVQARELYTKAKDLDPMPWRVLTDFNQAIRDLAEIDGVYLVDTEKSFQEYATHGLVGFPLVADNCHPTPIGNTIIARDMLTLMGNKGLFTENDPDFPSPGDSLEYYLQQTTTPDKRRSLEMEYLVNNITYSMKPPFYNYKASRMYIDKAMHLDPSNWVVWVNLATLSLLDNRIEEGRKQLARAQVLRGAQIDPDDWGHAPNLKRALEQSGVSMEELL